MRVGVFSDVHANRQALEACLRRLEAERVDALVCAGDLVGYGPDPEACVERVAALGAVCVAGNHDLIATGALSDERCMRLARESLRWTAAQLGERSREQLRALPQLAEAAGGLVVAHGSLDDPQRYVLTPGDACEQLAELARRFPPATLLVLGHTHEAALYGERRGELLRATTGTVALAPGERHLLNAGSVGQSRDRHALARFAVVDLEAATATFHAVPYDAAGTRAALRRRGLPASSCHQKPTALRAARRIAGRTRSAVRRRLRAARTRRAAP
jgi:predicted phosphodiesterase